MSRLASFALVSCVLSLSACVDPVREVTIPAGTFLPGYAFDDIGGSSVDIADVGDITLVIDLDAMTLQVQPADGEAVEVGLVARDRSEWIGGCATSNSHVEMEAADLDVESLQLGDVLIDAPMVSTNCGGSRVLLGSAGESGDFAGAVYLFEAAD